MRAAVRRLATRLGRRGTILALKGTIAVLYGYGQLTQPVPDRSGLRLLLKLMPLGRVVKRSCLVDHGWVIRRHELSDAEWEFVRPLLPHAESGRKRLDDRMVLNGIVWKFRTGSAWRDVPERYGSWATLHTRFRRWAADGTFERMLRAAQAKADAAGAVDWMVSVDSTIVRAHQHAAGARKGGSAARNSDGRGAA